jgi:hypothetical protein
VEHDCTPQVLTGYDTGDVVSPTLAEFVADPPLYLSGQDAPRTELVPIPGQREVRLGAQLPPCVLDRGLEWEVFEGVERVVMDEDADRALGRQQRRKPIEHADQGVVGGVSVMAHRNADGI